MCSLRSHHVHWEGCSSPLPNPPLKASHRQRPRERLAAQPRKDKRRFGKRAETERSEAYRSFGADDRKRNLAIIGNFCHTDLSKAFRRGERP